MTKCVVIKLYGDMEDAPKIAEPFTKVIPLDSGELEIVRAENRRLNALNGVRCYGDGVRFETACRELEVKYSVPQHGRLYRAFWGLIGYVVLATVGWYEYLSEWNRR